MSPSDDALVELLDEALSIMSQAAVASRLRPAPQPEPLNADLADIYAKAQILKSAVVRDVA